MKKNDKIQLVFLRWFVAALVDHFDWKTKKRKWCRFSVSVRWTNSSERAIFTRIEAKRIFKSDPELTFSTVLPIIQMMNVFLSIIIQWLFESMIRLDMHLVGDDPLFVTEINIFSSSLFRSGNRWKTTNKHWMCSSLSLLRSLEEEKTEQNERERQTIYHHWLFSMSLCVLLSLSLYIRPQFTIMKKSVYPTSIWRVEISIETERSRLGINLPFLFLSLSLLCFSEEKRLIGANLHLRTRCKVDWNLSLSLSSPIRSIISSSLNWTTIIRFGKGKKQPVWPRYQRRTTRENVLHDGN